MTCPFCYENLVNLIIDELGTMVAIRDQYPVTLHHMLIIPKRHTPDYLSMTIEEKQDAGFLLEILKIKLQQTDKSITGFNIGMNCGESAGQTIYHAHIHLIPRRDGDMDDPKGGVRGCIPERMKY